MPDNGDNGTRRNGTRRRSSGLSKARRAILRRQLFALNALLVELQRDIAEQGSELVDLSFAIRELFVDSPHVLTLIVENLGEASTGDKLPAALAEFITDTGDSLAVKHFLTVVFDAQMQDLRYALLNVDAVEFAEFLAEPSAGLRDGEAMRSWENTKERITRCLINPSPHLANCPNEPS